MIQIDDLISQVRQIALDEPGRNSWLTFDDGTDVSGIYSNPGDPNGTVAANIGSICLDTTNGVIYRKTTDTANTGWVDIDSPETEATAWTQGINGSFRNLSFTHSAGTLTVAGADGTALSATNPGYILMPSNATASRMALHTLTSNVTLTVSDMTGNIFNMTASTAYSNVFPVYFGFMADGSDENLVLVVSVLPNVTVSPSTSTDIGDPSAANADEQFSVFAASDITEADYTDKQICYIGGGSATKNASDVYTFAAINNEYEGTGKFNDVRIFTFANGLFGAGTNSPIKDNGGTAPVFSTTEKRYRIMRDGTIRFAWNFDGDGGTDGSGAVVSLIALPFSTYETSITRLPMQSGFGFTASISATEIMNTIFTAVDDAGIQGVYNGTNSFVNSSFGNGNRRWIGNCMYLANNGHNT